MARTVLNPHAKLRHVVPNLCKARRGHQLLPSLTDPQRMDTNTALATKRLGLTTSEAAEHLGVSLSTIRRWSDAGHLVGYRTPGGQRRFSTDQLDTFLHSLEREGRYTR
jgi:excisionase family DNA binding protein